jgi:hypothetical protein
MLIVSVPTANAEVFSSGGPATFNQEQAHPV